MRQTYRVVTIDDYALVISDDRPQVGEYCHVPDTSLFNGFTGVCILDTAHMDKAFKDAGFKFYKVVASIDKDMREKGVPMLILCKIKVGEQYRYRGFYNGESHDEIVIVESINGREVNMSNNIGTMLEEDGSCICLYELVISANKWTDEDIIKAFNKGSNSGAYHMKRQLKTGELTFKSGTDYLQSLQKKYPEYVDLEMETTGQCDCDCHKTENKIMHIMPYCNPKEVIKIIDKENNIIYL